MNSVEAFREIRKLMNLYHHQLVAENIEVETIKGYDINHIEEELIVFNIIINKKVDTNLLSFSKDYKQYKLLYGLGYLLSNDEYILVKKYFK